MHRWFIDDQAWSFHQDTRNLTENRCEAVVELLEPAEQTSYQTIAQALTNWLLRMRSVRTKTCNRRVWRAREEHWRKTLTAAPSWSQPSMGQKMSTLHRLLHSGSKDNSPSTRLPALSVRRAWKQSHHPSRLKSNINDQKCQRRRVTRRSSQIALLTSTSSPHTKGRSVGKLPTWISLYFTLATAVARATTARWIIVRTWDSHWIKVNSKVSIKTTRLVHAALTVTAIGRRE